MTRVSGLRSPEDTQAVSVTQMHCGKSFPGFPHFNSTTNTTADSDSLPLGLLWRACSRARPQLSGTALGERFDAEQRQPAKRAERGGTYCGVSTDRRHPSVGDSAHVDHEGCGEEEELKRIEAVDSLYKRRSLTDRKSVV